MSPAVLSRLHALVSTLPIVQGILRVVLSISSSSVLDSATSVKHSREEPFAHREHQHCRGVACLQRISLSGTTPESWSSGRPLLVSFPLRLFKSLPKPVTSTLTLVLMISARWCRISSSTMLCLLYDSSNSRDTASPCAYRYLRLISKPNWISYSFCRRASRQYRSFHSA